MKDLKKVRARALYFLGKRAYGLEELRAKLIEKKYEPESVHAVIAQLEDEKLFDDEDLIRRWLDVVAEKRGYGYAKIAHMLSKRHFDSSLINAVYEAHYKEKELDVALRIAEQKKHFLSTSATHYPEEKLKEKIGRFLISRGFNQSIVYQVFDRLLS